LNSRYSLSGFQYVKLKFGSGRDIEIKNLTLNIPNEGSHNIDLKSKDNQKSRWNDYLFAGDTNYLADKKCVIPVNSIIRLNLVLSRISYPKENALQIELESSSDQKLEVQVFKGEYSPYSAAQFHNRWISMKTIDIKKGENKIEVPIDWALSDLISYPTNFLKVIDNKNYNVYHFVHISRLKEFYLITGNEELGKYSDKWEEYTTKWAKADIYQGMETTRPKALLGSSP
jgi:hypothetical protein